MNREYFEEYSFERGKRYEYVEGVHRKFYEIALFDCASNEPAKYGPWLVVKCWGRIGTEGQSINESFADPDQAADYFQELCEQRIKKGYKLVSNTITPNTLSHRGIIEEKKEDKPVPEAWASENWDVL